MVNYKLRDNISLEEPAPIKSEIIEEKKLPETPVPVKDEFLRKNGLVGKSKVKAKELEEKQPLLLLLKENGDAEFVKNVNQGVFTVVKKKGGEKSILIDNKKIFNLRYGGEKVKIRVGYENEATCYPLDQEHDSRMLNILLKKIVFDREEFAKGTKGLFDSSVLLAIGVGIVIVAIYFLYQNGTLAQIFGG